MKDGITVTERIDRSGDSGFKALLTQPQISPALHTPKPTFDIVDWDDIAKVKISREDDCQDCD